MARHITERLDGVRLSDPTWTTEPVPGTNRHTELDLADSDEANRERETRAFANVEAARRGTGFYERVNRITQKRSFPEMLRELDQILIDSQLKLAARRKANRRQRAVIRWYLRGKSR